MGQSLCEPSLPQQNPDSIHSYLPPLNRPDLRYAYPSKIPADVMDLMEQEVLKAFEQQPQLKIETQLESDNEKRGEFIDQTYFLLTYSVYYRGQWKKGYPHGLGCVTFRNGERLKCVLNAGTVNYEDCFFMMKDGSSYRGEIRDNKFQGYGEFRQTNGHRLQGQWHDGAPHGQGIERFRNGDVYRGCYVNGRKEGNSCEYIWNDSQFYDRYQGGFAEDYFSGIGRLTKKDGTTIVGNFNESKIENAKIENDKYICSGNLEEGKLQGPGDISLLKESKVLKSTFRNGQPGDVAVLTDAQGQQFSGRWVIGNHIKKQQNLSMDQMHKITALVHETLKQSDFYEDLLQNLGSQLPQEYKVTQITSEQIDKIEHQKYCIFELDSFMMMISS